jgi:YidC/Oxa1 family membrane protein insertase
MGVSTLSPQAAGLFMWGLPGLSLIFTWWLPAALQLSFFVSGILSFFQASALRQPWFRRIFRMTPLPTKAPVTAPAPYQGKLKIAANPVLSQAELSQRFQGAGNTAEKIGEIQKAAPPGVVGKIFGGAVKEVKGAVDGIKDSAMGVVNMSKEKLASQTESGTKKADAKERKRFEEKRQEELRKARWDLEAAKRAERAAKKHQK